MQNLRPRIQERFRRYTSGLRTVPDFIIIGGMKCGSTALFEYLIQHPHVNGSFIKEVHFFDNRYMRGAAWYRKHFPLEVVKGRQVTGEASPYYIFHPLAPARIKEILPDVKLIALLRDPVHRAYSHYQHTRRKGYETLSFADAVAAEEERLAGEYEHLVMDPNYTSHAYPAYSYVERGIYWKQIQRYYEHFDHSQLFIVRSEDMANDPQAVVNDVAAFLGLAPFVLKDDSPRNGATYERNYTDVHARLASFFQPHNEKLYDLVGRDFGWDESY